ncbi:hypothetical protein D3C71_1637340 [compost metagenome]
MARAWATTAASQGFSGSRSSDAPVFRSLARSLTPSISPFNAPPASAMSRRSTRARGVSIMAHSSTPGRIASDRARTVAAFSTLGATIRSTGASRSAARSSAPQGVSSPLIRTPRRGPKPPSRAAATAAARASAFISGATASSRSSTATSQARPRAFSTARALEAGR